MVVHPTTADLHAVGSGWVGVIPAAGDDESSLPVVYAAVGNGGTILTSSDAVNWVAQISGTTVSLNGIAASPPSTDHAAFGVAVGDGGAILTSTDRIHWTARASRTMARLNGVACAQQNDSVIWLAVGDGGIACVSHDGLNWTAESTGVTGWLRGIEANYSPSGPFQFVVVGQAGTVLLTSDGVNFTRVPTGTNQDLESVTWGIAPDGIQTAYVIAETGGQIGFVTGYDQVNPAYSSIIIGNGTARFFAVADGPVEMVAGSGGQGAQEPSAIETFDAIQLPTQQADVYGLTPLGPSQGGGFVAVGAGGVVATAVAPSAVPSVVTNAEPVVVGSPLTLEAPVINGATYQWFSENGPVDGTTGPALTISNVQFTQPSSCQVEVDTGDWVYSEVQKFEIIPPPQYSPSVLNLSVSPSAGGPFVTLNNGQLLLVPDLVRLNSDGSTDLSFRGNATVVAANPTPNPTDPSLSELQGSVLQQSDGKLVLLVNGGSTVYAVRLNVDGSLDTTFSIASAQLDSSSAIAPAVNGGFLLYSSHGGALSWTLLDSVGAATGPAQSIPLPLQWAAVSNVVVTGEDSSGNVWAAVNASPEFPSTGEGAALYAFTAFGSPLSGFGQGRYIAKLQVDRFSPVGTGMYVVMVDGLVGNWSVTVIRLNRDGTTDPTWPTLTETYGVPGDPSGEIAILPDGSVVLAYPIPFDGSEQFSSYRLAHLSAQGVADPDFGAYLEADDALWEIAPATGPGTYWVAGYFRELNGVFRNQLAEITLGNDYAGTHLTNFSTLGQVDGPGQPAELGFILEGDGSRDLLLRAGGPALWPFDVVGAAVDPTATLFQNGTVIAFDDNWGDGGNGPVIADAEAADGAFPFASGSADAALVESLGAGNYLLQAGAHGSSGTGLAEAYDGSAPPAGGTAARVVNFSTLAQISPATPIANLSFTVGGTNARAYLVRAVGPSLAQFGIADPLPDPTLSILSLRNASAGDIPLTGGSAWIDQATVEVGAFALPGGFGPNQQPAYDWVEIVVVPAGEYTLQASSSGNNTGQVLLEVYEIP
jgi:hypothetical protein